MPSRETPAALGEEGARQKNLVSPETREPVKPLAAVGCCGRRLRSTDVPRDGWWSFPLPRLAPRTTCCGLAEPHHTTTEENQVLWTG